MVPYRPKSQVSNTRTRKLETVKLRLTAVCLVSSLLLAGCPDGKKAPANGGTKPADGGGATTPAADGKPWDAAKATATISGSVKLDGKPPRGRPVDMSGADAKCSEAHGGERLQPETVVLNANGTLKNVFVSVKKGVEGFAFTAPTDELLLDQNGCVYKPHVSGMQSGQSLRVKTSDPTAHNVHGFGKIAFNRSQPAGAEDIVLKMNRGQEYPPFKVKCDIHPWMNAYIAVMDHPFFVVTGDDGSFTLPKLAAGTYTVEAWHEKYGASEQSVTVADGETKTVEFAFKGK
jgi:hypothetical protein